MRSTGVVLLIVLIPAVATQRQTASSVFTAFNKPDVGIHNNVYIFLLGLLMSQYNLSAYDASAHMVRKIYLICTNPLQWVWHVLIITSWTCLIHLSWIAVINASRTNQWISKCKWLVIGSVDWYIPFRFSIFLVLTQFLDNDLFNNDLSNLLKPCSFEIEIQKIKNETLVLVDILWSHYYTDT